MIIRAATHADTDALLEVEREAFGGPDEAALVVALMAGNAFLPTLSLIAEEDGQVVGHVLFTIAYAGDTRAVLLAPLAVAPDRQRDGVGSALVRAGFAEAERLGFGLALVLGYPEYYPRFGFEPAEPHGITPPYPVEPSEAWMVVELIGGTLETACGAVRVAEELMHPEMWRE